MKQKKINRKIHSTKKVYTLQERWIELAMKYDEFKKKGSVQSFFKFIIFLLKLSVPVLIKWLLDKFFGKS